MVVALELVERLLLIGTHHVGDVRLGMDIADARLRPLIGKLVADRLHQVGLAQAHAAVDKQRVIGNAGVLGDLHGGGPRQLVRLAGDEAVEGERRIEPGALEVRGYFGRASRGRRHARGGFDRPRENQAQAELAPAGLRDRKSTRLNSSHSQISYAVFCLKKKKKKKKKNMQHKKRIKKKK